jgi:hypothetical protein
MPTEATLTDLITSTEAGEMLPPSLNGNVRRIEPYRRVGRITPVMRVGSSKRAPLLFSRKDVERLRDELVVELETQLRHYRQS